MQKTALPTENNLFVHTDKKTDTHVHGATSRSNKAVRGVIAAASFLVDCAMILIMTVIFGYGAYSIWDTNQIYTASDAKQYETYKPLSNDHDSPSFNELVVMNPDVLGWINVYGTGIDYPLVQGEDNDEYMNTTATGEFALGGSIFLDHTNAKDFTDFNTVIYGHHMEKSEMFGDIDKFDDQQFFESHQYGNLYYGGKNHGLKFFAMVDADAYDFTLYNPHVEDPASYLDYIKSKARYWRDGVADSNSHIVMLSTCASTATNGRYVLFGAITDDTYQNTFETKPVVISRTLTGGSSTVPAQYYWIAGAALSGVLILVICLIVHHHRKRKG